MTDTHDAHDAPGTPAGVQTALDTLDWRHQTFWLYDNVRIADESEGPEEAHGFWKLHRGDMLRRHPASPIPLALRGIREPIFAPYDPAWRFEVEVEPTEPRRWEVETGTDGVVPFELLGVARLPGVVLDFNFAYNPSCAYDPAWACPLAPAGNTVDVPIPVGERMP